MLDRTLERLGFEGDDPLSATQRLFDAVPAGITHLLQHPLAPGHDIEAITNSAAYRIADSRTFFCGPGSRPTLPSRAST